MPRLLHTTLALTCLLCLAAGAPARGQIFVDTDAGGANDGSSWADAYTDLQTAIDNAASSNEIWVAEGVYTRDSEGDSFTITGAKDGLETYGGFDGTESTRSARDPQAHPAVLSGDIGGDDNTNANGVTEDASDISGSNAFTVLVLDGTTGGTITASTVIDGVTVTGGEANNSFLSAPLQERSGGGLYCDGSGSGNECSPTLRQVAFRGNEALFDGGAIYNGGDSGGNASPSVTNAVFASNSAGDQGGAMLNAANSGGTSSPTLMNVVFAGNSSSSFGGAMYNAGPGGTASPTITNVAFSNNTTSGDGGAIYNNARSDGTAAPQITNTILWGNTADADGNGTGSGDEILNSNATPTLSHSSVQGSGGSGSNWDSSLGTDGGGNLDQDPRFLNAGDPDGADGSFRSTDDGLNVDLGSPALDVGDNGALPSDAADLDGDNDTSEPIPFDLTGADRTQDKDEDGTATVNIGAYEAAQPGPPTATTGSFSGIGATSADLSSTVNPGGVETTLQAEVNPTSDPTDVTTVTPSASPLTGHEGKSVTIAINGLAPNLEYEARVIASSSEGGDRGSYVTFTTTSDGYARRIKGTDGTGNDAGWRMLALPAAGKTRAALEDDLKFNVGSGSILYRWMSGSWSAQAGSSDNLPRGRGFMLYFFDDFIDPIDSEGIPLAVSTGSENQSSDKTVGSLSTSETFHLLGNPYDAAFDLGSLAGGDLPAAGFQATVQVWDPEAGSYTQITQGNTGDEIGAWQGFFVERSTEGAGQTSLTFSTSGKQSGDGSLIGSKSTSLLAASAGQKAPSKQASAKRSELELRLTVTGEASDDDTTPPGPSGKSGAGRPALASPTRDTSKNGAAAKEAETDTLARSQATVLFAEEAAAGWDAYEASQLTPFSSGGYATLSSPLLRASSQGDSTLVRRALASEPSPTDTSAVPIPLSVRSVGTAGEATIGWPEAARDRLPEGWTAELIDTERGARVDLRGKAYSFELAEGDGEVETPSDSRFRLRVGPASAIPVELAGFEVQVVDDESVRLSWTTASEQNNAGFYVQRKGEREKGRGGAWTTVDFVEGSGTTTESKRYRFTDRDLLFAAERLVYRLKQVDTDGSVRFSKAVIVERGEVEELTLHAPFPNPARSRATVRYALPKAQEVRLVVYDVLGRRVQTLVNARQEAGRKQVHLETRGLSSGTYLLRLTGGSAAKTRRLTIVR